MFAKLANNRKLEEATSAKDDVAPSKRTLFCNGVLVVRVSHHEGLCAVYVLDEIAEMANGGGDTAQGLADATVKRLGNKSPIVKHKVVQASSTMHNGAWLMC